MARDAADVALVVLAAGPERMRAAIVAARRSTSLDCCGISLASLMILAGIPAAVDMRLARPVTALAAVGRRWRSAVRLQRVSPVIGLGLMAGRARVLSDGMRRVGRRRLGVCVFWHWRAAWPPASVQPQRRFEQ